jgi:hypothetical protein
MIADPSGLFCECTIWTWKRAPAKPIPRLARSGKVGVVQFVLRTREILCVLNAKVTLTFNTCVVIASRSQIDSLLQLFKLVSKNNLELR